MKIDWKIKKKRGNFRPVLTYTMVLEPFEKSLAMPAVFLDTGIPHIPRPHQPFCLPHENERSPGWQPDRFHRLQVPYFRTGETNGFIRLPFRASGDYPEVEEAFKQLHQLYETKVCEAYAQPPFETRNSLDISSEAREKVSARVTAERLLAIFN